MSVLLSLKTKLSTDKLAETTAFYRQLFDLQMLEEWDHPGDKGVILGLGGDRNEALLEIYDSNTGADFSGLSLQFRVADIQAFVRSLPETLEYEGPRVRPWGSTYVYIRDPNDVLIIVYEGGL